LVFCIPVDKEIDLKAAAALTGNKKIEMVHVKELLGLTGYIRGGCSPIGMKKKFPTYFDASAEAHGKITVSAGVRGAQMLVDREVLVRFVDGKLINVAK
jgi:Cys-tRNA(Pro)/Cys-tRNA(Cys) deacylase